MAKFRVRVSTGEACGAGTWDKVSVSIVGTHGESPLVPLDHLGKEFSAGAVSFWGAGNRDWRKGGQGDHSRHTKQPFLGRRLRGDASPGRWHCADAANTQGTPGGTPPASVFPT